MNSGGRLVLTLGWSVIHSSDRSFTRSCNTAGKVHAISSQEPIEEDLFLLMAGDNYETVEDWRVRAEQDHHLFERGMNRVTDVCIPEEEAIRRVESMILDVWKEEQDFHMSISTRC